jgi:hypothetical protein
MNPAIDVHAAGTKTTKTTKIKMKTILTSQQRSHSQSARTYSRSAASHAAWRRGILAGLALIICTPMVRSATFSDGGTHIVNTDVYKDEGVVVKNNTTVIFEAGAVLGGAGVQSGQLQVLDTSSVTINGGTFGGDGINSGLVGANNGTATVTINGGTFGGDGNNSGRIRALELGTFTSVIINGGIFGGAGAGSGVVEAWGNPGVGTVTFRGSAFDTTSYNPLSGGTLGVTFCAQSPQFITVRFFGGTVVQETVACVIDTDGDGVPDDEDECPNSLDVGSTIKIGGTDTGVPNVVFENGCTISDMIADLADGAKNHGQFVRHVAALKNALRKEGILTAEEAEALQSAAAESSLP